MKKIGIITLQNGNNFGAMYQCFALQEYLKKSGHEVFIVNYEMTRDSSSLIDYLSKPVQFFQKLRDRKVLSAKFRSSRNETGLELQIKEKYDDIFKEFRKTYLNITEKEYDYTSLSESTPNADIFICGSDQVWAADFLFTSPAFLLGFAPKGVKRISYAPSFGKKKLETYLYETFKTYIKQFDAISVRETSGKDIVEKVANIDAKVVLDPTLLLDKKDYSSIIKLSNIPDEPYVLVYLLSQEEELFEWSSKVINKLKTITNMPIYYVSTNNIWSPDRGWQVLHPTPGELLGLFTKSSMVLTNSFHGTVFSLILQKKFVSFARDKYEDKQNLRITELLSNVNLLDHFCRPFESLSIVQQKFSLEIDYDKVTDQLKPLIKSSSDFLKSSIS